VSSDQCNFQNNLIDIRYYGRTRRSAPTPRRWPSMPAIRSGHLYVASDHCNSQNYLIDIRYHGRARRSAPTRRRWPSMSGIKSGHRYVASDDCNAQNNLIDIRYHRRSRHSATHTETYEKLHYIDCHPVDQQRASRLPAAHLDFASTLR
jgi:hypothetical protein